MKGEKKPVLARAGDEQARQQAADTTLWAGESSTFQEPSERPPMLCQLPLWATGLAPGRPPCLRALLHSGLENEKSTNHSQIVKAGGSQHRAWQGGHIHSYLMSG